MNDVLHRMGDVIGARYEITGFVGQGGMQEVFRARDGLLNREVALKVPKSSSAEKRFKRSAVLSARVNHANVAKTLDYLEEGGRFYLIEELIDGCDLARFLLNYIPKLDPYSSARVLHHVAKGVSASHHVNVVHRDLKPSNVMVTGGSRFNGFKVTDFGIAKMAQREIKGAVEGGNEGLTASQTALGALPYMAPETIDDLQNAGKPADVWAVGAIAIELLTGKKPFGAGYKAVPLIQAARLPEPPASLAKLQYAELGTKVYRVAASCLLKDPAARPTADQLVHACEELCYSVADREFGTIYSCEHGRYGFIACEEKGRTDVMYHVDSIYGAAGVKLGQRVWFSRHPGSPRERAFPVVFAAEADGGSSLL